MQAFIGHARFTLGAVALLALAAGCSHEPKPRQAKQPSPTFESKVGEQGQQKNVGTMGAPGAPGTQQPAPEPTTGPETAAPPPVTPEPTQPGAPGTMGGGAPSTMGTEPTAPQINEREMCDTLGSDATLVVQDIQGGAAIVISPKAGKDLDSVRSDASHLEQAISTVNPHAAAAGADMCALFDLGRQGAHIAIVEGPKSVKMNIVAADPSTVKAVRSQVRDFVKSQSVSKGGKGQPGKEHKGGTGKTPKTPPKP